MPVLPNSYWICAQHVGPTLEFYSIRPSTCLFINGFFEIHSLHFFIKLLHMARNLQNAKTEGALSFWENLTHIRGKGTQNKFFQVFWKYCLLNLLRNSVKWKFLYFLVSHSITLPLVIFLLNLMSIFSMVVDVYKADKLI